MPLTTGSGCDFCLMMEGSGSGRPKNMWIRWIRIRNTGCTNLWIMSHFILFDPFTLKEPLSNLFNGVHILLQKNFSLSSFSFPSLAYCPAHAFLSCPVAAFLPCLCLSVQSLPPCSVSAFLSYLCHLVLSLPPCPVSASLSCPCFLVLPLPPCPVPALLFSPCFFSFPSFPM
jgi:hypothetical protein